MTICDIFISSPASSLGPESLILYNLIIHLSRDPGSDLGKPNRIRA